MGELSSEEYRALPEVLTPQQASAMLGISSRRLIEMAGAGTVPARKIGRAWRFSKSRLEDYLRGE